MANTGAAGASGQQITKKKNQTRQKCNDQNDKHIKNDTRDLEIRVRSVRFIPQRLRQRRVTSHYFFLLNLVRGSDPDPSASAPVRVPFHPFGFGFGFGFRFLPMAPSPLKVPIRFRLAGTRTIGAKWEGIRRLKPLTCSVGVAGPSV